MNRIINMIEEKEKLKHRAQEEMADAPSMRNYGNSPLLCKVGKFIYSYNTCVAVIMYVGDRGGECVLVPRYHSATTTRHINKVADDYRIKVIKLY